MVVAHWDPNAQIQVGVFHEVEMSAEDYHSDFYDPPRQEDDDDGYNYYLGIQGPRTVKCSACGGKGRFQLIREAGVFKICQKCKGTGKVTEMPKKTTKKTVGAQTIQVQLSPALKKQLGDFEKKVREQIDRELKLQGKMFGTPDEPPFVWKAYDGKRLHPKEMDEEHLRNSISFVQRRLSSALANAVYLDSVTWLVRALYEFLKEAKRRGIKV